MLEHQKCKHKKPEGCFIVFEGAHASGKTTQAKMLCKYLQTRGIEAHYTKEPYSRELRPLIGRYADAELINPLVLMYLLAADRCIHVKDINDWIREGKWVICDRYVLSSLVYQQIQGIPLNDIRRANSFATKPHLTLYIDSSLRERTLRVRRRHKDHRTFFLRDENLIKEQELYDRLTKNWNERLHGKIEVINGQQNIMKIHERILNLLPIGLK